MFIYPRWQVSPAVWWQYLFPVAALLLVAGILDAGDAAGAGRWPRCCSSSARCSPRWDSLTCIRSAIPSWPIITSTWPASGIIAGASAVLALWLNRWRWWTRPPGRLLCLTLLAILSVLTWRQCRMYRDVETLWRTTLARNPACFVAYSNLGNALLQQGQVDEAIRMCEKALELEPRSAEAHNNLANALLKKGQVDEALRQYQKALEIRPDLAVAHCNIGYILLQRGPVGRGDSPIPKSGGTPARVRQSPRQPRQRSAAKGAAGRSAGALPQSPRNPARRCRGPQQSGE